MDTNTYWNKQREITTAVRCCALSILQQYPQLFKEYIWLTNLLDAEKKERSSVRAAMTCLMYEACGEDTWEGAIGIAATGELEITSLYHLNRLLDRKGSGSWAREHPYDIGMPILVAGWMRNAGQAAFSAAVMERPDSADLVYEFESIDQATIAGAFIDLYEMEKSIFKMPEEVQLETYLRRCRLMNAYFFETMCGIAAKLAGASEEVTEQARNFGTNYGMALQIVNDLADFVPPEDGPGTREKSSNDAWADLRNYRVTLPIILGRSHGSVACRELIDRLLYCACGASEPYRELTNLLVHEGHIASAQEMAKGYAKKAHESLQVFPKEKRSHLSAMLVLFSSNRYYRALAKYKE